MNFRIVSTATPAQPERRLLLIFAGWAMDAAPFSHIKANGMDVAVVWDYRDIDTPLPDTIASYSEICIMAWSFGIPAAARFMSANPQLPITARVAINGTMTPVNDRTGIPEAIFRGTLEGLCERSLTKFYRRMCGSAEAFARFMSVRPERDITTLAAELEAVAGRHTTYSNSLWDSVVISAADAIIPPANQEAAWQGHHDIRRIDAPHMPDMQQLVNTLFTNKPLISDRFRGCRDSYSENADIQSGMALRLASLWPAAPGCPRRIIEIGAGSGAYTRVYAPHTGTTDRLELWDIADIEPSLPGEHRITDAETAILTLPPHSVDIITGSASIQWMNSPALFVSRCLSCLRPGGILLLSTFGPDNFKEITDTDGSAPHYISAQAWTDIISAEGFSAEISEERIVRQFSSPSEMLRHIRLTGVNAVQDDPLKAAAKARRIVRTGTCALTYHPIYIRVIAGG